MLAKKLESAAKAVEPVYIEDVFSTWLYAGTGTTAGSTQTITNGIDLAGEGGMVWIKDRAVKDHFLFDTNRGPWKYLRSNTTDAQPGVNEDALSAFNSNGFTLTGDNNVTQNGQNYASWTFRKQPKFFDVVTFISDGTTNQAVSHSLGSAPGCIFIKRTDAAQSWIVWHRGNGTTNYYTWSLNNTAAAASTSDLTAYMTSTSFQPNRLDDYLGNKPVSGGTYVAYLFAHDAGGFGLTGTDNVISCGSWIGNGGSVSVNLGYEPQWILYRRSDSTSYWHMLDNMRGVPTGGNDSLLWANVADAESTSADQLDFNATGFTIKNTAALSVSGATYIYIAIRRGPMKTPTTGTSVFHALSRSGTSAVATISSGSVGPVDLILAKSRNVSNDPRLWDRLRGPQPFLSTAATQQEFTRTTVVLGFDSMTGVRVQDATDEFINTSGVASPYINYMFRRAPGFMDVVCYTGTGVARTVAHNLGVAPELMIVKARSAATAWIIYHSALGNNASLSFSTGAVNTPSTTWNTTTPTSSSFTVGTSGATNGSSVTLVAYLFASCPGVSKVGSYTGTGTTQQIDCGFTSGARFVLIKRTDSTGDWYVWDSARGIVAGNDPYLLLNSTAAEVTSTDYIDPVSSGFEISSTAPAAINANSGTFIFLAIA